MLSYKIDVIKERCKGCGFCVEFCPRHVLRQSSEINSKRFHTIYVDKSEECSGCNICTMICPDFAISVAAEGNYKTKVEL